MTTRRVALPADLRLSVAQILKLPDEEQEKYIVRLQEHTARDSRWTWTDKQQRLHLNCLEYDENLGGGAAGGGKSWFLVQHAKWLATNWKGARIGLFRRTYPRLRSTLIPHTMRAYRIDEGWKWRAQDKEWHLQHDDGSISVVQFGHARYPDDVRQYDSTEFAAILVDELAEWDEEMWVFLVGRLRATVEQEEAGWHLHMCGTSNPGGKGHAWMKRRFVDPTAEGAHVAELLGEPGVPESAYTVSYTPFGVLDNPHVASSYMKSLYRLPPILRRQRMYGDWSINEGTAFGEFSRQTHCMPFTVDPAWRHRAGCDYGYSAQTFIVWGAQDFNGTVWIYREWSATQLVPADIAQRLERFNLEPVGDDLNRDVPKVERWVWDNQIWRKEYDGHRIVDRFRVAGMKDMFPAFKDRVAGWLQVHEYLQPADYAEHADPQSCLLPPKLFVSTNCPMLLTAIEDAQTDPKSPEDIVTTNPHALDAFRYLICDYARLSPPSPQVDDPIENLTGIDYVVANQIRKEQMQRRRKRRARNHPRG